jgi:hypothetical protein
MHCLRAERGETRFMAVRFARRFLTCNTKNLGTTRVLGVGTVAA